MTDLCFSRLLKPNSDLGEGEGGGFRRSLQEYRDRRHDRRSAAAVIFTILG